ncbi:PHP domain-containing protein [Oscillospiraceae bacterium LTW-04]|nr:PHP domain-containing protein [Oscillospiraceae bacterium MB24-C1]
MLRWDLHVHTAWSDGSMAVSEVVAFAARRGLRGIAITDHDAMDMIAPAQQAAKTAGIDIVPGVELSCINHDTGRKVHLLVYCPQVLSPLEPLFEMMAERRQRVGEEMIDLLVRHYPVTREQVLIHAKNSKTINRVHLLRALLEMGYSDRVYGSLYQALFGKEGVCRRQVDYIDVYEGARAAQASGGAVVLAHPDVYDSFDIGERLAKAGLIDGLEYSYPRRNPEHIGKHDRLVQAYGLITTGGTDFHGFYTTTPNPIGTCTTSEYELAQLHKLIELKRK